MDNGTAFMSQALDVWAEHRGVHLDCSRPGKPNDNAFIESINSRLRSECLKELRASAWARARHGTPRHAKHLPALAVPLCAPCHTGRRTRGQQPGIENRHRD